MHTTFLRIGDRLFNPAMVQEVNLNYDPKRYDRLKPPAGGAGVEVTMSSGLRLSPFWGAEAEALRAYFDGRPVRREVYHRIDDEDEAILTVVHLNTEPEPEPATLT